MCRRCGGEQGPVPAVAVRMRRSAGRCGVRADGDEGLASDAVHMDRTRTSWHELPDGDRRRREDAPSERERGQVLAVGGVRDPGVCGLVDVDVPSWPRTISSSGHRLADAPPGAPRPGPRGIRRDGVRLGSWRRSRPARPDRPLAHARALVGRDVEPARIPRGCARGCAGRRHAARVERLRPLQRPAGDRRPARRGDRGPRRLRRGTGWRGFALPQLQRRYGALAAALLVTPIWAVWHVPCFFTVATYRDFAPVGYVGFVFGLACGSIVLTWLYNGTGGSILACAVWHGAYNLASGTAAADGTIAAVTSTFVMVQALLLVGLELRARRRGTASVLGPAADKRPVPGVASPSAGGAPAERVVLELDALTPDLDPVSATADTTRRPSCDRTTTRSGSTRIRNAARCRMTWNSSASQSGGRCGWRCRFWPCSSSPQSRGRVRATRRPSRRCGAFVGPPLAVVEIDRGGLPEVQRAPSSRPARRAPRRAPDARATTRASFVARTSRCLLRAGLLRAERARADGA